MRLIAALLLLSISASAATVVAPAGVPGLPDPLDCGRYQISGLLGGSATDGSFIQVYPGTTRRFDLALRQLDAEDELSYVGHDVRLVLLITKPGRGAAARARVVGRATLITRSESLGSPVQLLEKMDCRSIPAPSLK